MRPSPFLIAGLLLVGGIAAQTPALADDLQLLLRAESREAAAARLVAGGVDAFAPLCAFAVRTAPVDADATVAAIRVLLQIGPAGAGARDALDAVIAELRTSLPGAAQFLAQVKAPKDPRTALAMESGELFLGLCAVRAGMKLAADADLESLRAALADSDPGVALAAASRLATQGSSAAAALPALRELEQRARSWRQLIEEPKATVREEQGAKIATFEGGERACVLTLGKDTARFERSTLIDAVLAHAVAAIGAHDVETIGTHLGRLKSTDPAARATAARALGEIGPDAIEATGALCTAARDADSRVAREAILALGRIGSDTALVRRVLRSLAAGSSEELGRCAQAVLAQFDRPKKSAPSRK